MRFMIVLATVFSVCCCLSILNLFAFDATGQKSEQFYLAERALLNYTLTDEEILRCLNFMDKIINDLNESPSSEELQDILFQCSLLLQENSKPLENKNEDDSTRSSLLENHRNDKYDFITEEQSTIESSDEVNGNNTGAKEISGRTSERKGNDVNSTSEPLTGKFKDLKDMSTDEISKLTTQSSGLWNFFFRSKVKEVEAALEKPDNDKELQKMPTTMTPKPIDKSSGLRRLFFWNKGSTDNSSSILVTEQKEGNSTEKPDNQKTKFDTVILNSRNMIWSLWNDPFRASDSSISSNGIQSFENLEIGPIMQSDIYLVNSTDLENPMSENSLFWKIIMPGTKWCGSGSKAENYDDLGYFEDVDRCCRAHDKCYDIMLPGESKHNLTNTSQFTVLNCKCDDELYDCLSQINSVASNTVGNTYFNIFSRMCYMLDYPNVCKKHYTLLGCQEYVIDKTAEKVYQWKPAKKYRKMPLTIPSLTRMTTKPATLTQIPIQH